jgi:23S rRNA (cytosine1962-C5)-methyltransferase
VSLPSADVLARSFEKARDRRRALLTSETNCVRLVHSHADGVPGVTVDSFGGELVVASTYETFSEDEEQAIGRACVDVFAPKSVYLKRRPREARHVANVAASEVSPTTPLQLAPMAECVGLENGLRYLIRPAAGLSVGLFLDMRDTRAWLRGQVSGKTVLNCFSYTCAFSVAARSGGAARVANIDVSRRVLDWGVENHAANGLSTDKRDFIAGDVFEWLARFAKKSESFDVVVLDPPSFATTAKSRFSAARDYPKLVQAALSVLPKGGTLVACCNLSQLDDRGFLALVEKGFALAGRRAGKRTPLRASEVDFPPHPETPHGLHVVALQT